MTRSAPRKPVKPKPTTKPQFDLSKLDYRPIRGKQTFLAALTSQQRAVLFAVRRKFQGEGIQATRQDICDFLLTDHKITINVSTLKNFLLDDGTVYKEVDDGDKAHPRTKGGQRRRK